MRIPDRVRLVIDAHGIIHEGVDGELYIREALAQEMTPAAKSRRFATRRKAAGLCIDCGKPRDGASGVRCRACKKRKRESERRRMGHKPWRPGARGRPPLD